MKQRATVQNTLKNRMLKKEKKCPNDWNKTGSPFTETRNLFRSYIDYTEPLTFDQWLSLDDGLKAAVLYVQFYDQITLAWYKTRSFYTLEEDGVSTVCQYLVKNVPIIEEKPSRFSAAYIYKVAYNCLYCICHDIKRDRDRYELECSNIVQVGDDTLDLFDTVVDNVDMESVLDRESFWAVIEEMGPDAVAVVEQLLNGGRLPAGVRAAKDEIIEELKEKLLPYLSIFYS